MIMLQMIRRLGMGQSTEPSIPGMQVLDWRVVQSRQGKCINTLAHKDSKLYVAAYLDDSSQYVNNYTQVPSTPTVVQHPEAVDFENIFPKYFAQFALYCKNGNTQREVYVKRVNLLDTFTADGMSALQTSRASQITEHEASIRDRLSLYQNPNIVEFLGVQVRDVLDYDYHGMNVSVLLTQNHITGLVFTKYDYTLHELIIRRKKVNLRSCLQFIWAGIQFLHRVGVVHGDIRPHNIFVKRDKNKDQFVIGNFDCAQHTGRVMTLKTGDPRWTKCKVIGQGVAKESDDWTGFIMLKEWLVQETRGRLEDFIDIGKNRPTAE